MRHHDGSFPIVVTGGRRFAGALLAAGGLMAALASTAHAADPRMGGGMVHLIVEFDGTAMHVSPESTGPLSLQSYDETYDAAAAVLDGTAYNAQYGWLVGGFWGPPFGTAVWIERIEATPGLATYAQGTFAPIFGTDGSSSRRLWNGTMTHDWYAVTAPGDYAATFRVYLGDPVTGEPAAGYEAAEIEVSWFAEGSACPADLDGDGTVSGSDFGLLLSAWGTADADLDGDGITGGSDVGVMLAAWGGCG
jgi:hypothetical protein